MTDLSGQVALVTGASRGLGKGIALVLAEEGANIVVNYRSSKKEAEETAEMIRSLGREALPIQADVSNAEDVAKMFIEIQSCFQKIDILVNNAGTTQAKDIFEINEQDWDFILDTNMKSCYLCSKEAFKMMKHRKRGRIINISSVVGEQGALYGHVHYATTKSGMLGFTKTLARTGAPFGITVNAIAPGIIETELLIQTHGREKVDQLSKQVPLGLGTPRDVGCAAAFLCGEGARYITGATIDVNGGMYMR